MPSHYQDCPRCGHPDLQVFKDTQSDGSVRHSCYCHHEGCGYRDSEGSID